MLSLTTGYAIPLKTTVSYASNENVTAGGLSNFNYDLLSLGAGYGFLNERLTGFTEYRYTGVSVTLLNGDPLDYSRSHVRFGATFYIGPRHSVLVDAHIISYNSVAEGVSSDAGSYTDQIFRIRYEHYF